MIGKTISHYKVVEKLGEGGMGIVYKAEDTKLERTVALKFLPERLTVNDTEKARFLQEAKAAAALNHPNVCVIYEIQEDAEKPFIAMEYVDGKTLRDIIASNRENPFTTNQAIAYAIQIGDALLEAHSNDIVHRDIKSENIMVNSKNQIKVMDFGLAKLKGSLKLTQTVSTMGTLAYMSPEQIKSSKVDTRSDIFSFGVVLYEMLTSELPFKGDYEASLMYSVLNEEPEPLQTHIPDPSSELIHIINRVLEKEPEERYQNMADLLIDLRRVKKETGKVSRKSLIDLPAHKPTPSFTFKISPKMLGLAGAVIAILFLAFLFFRPDGSTKLNPDMSFRVLSTPYPVIWYPSLSKDGNWIAFPSRDPNGLWGIYLMNSAGGDARRIATDSIHINNVDISPDGSQVAYTRWFSAGMPAKVFVVSSLGGQRVQLAEWATTPEWHPDGRRIGYIHLPGFGPGKKKEVWSVRPDGSDDRREYSDNAPPIIGRLDFSWSPDGKSIAWLRTFPGLYTEIIIVDLQSGEERQLTFDRKIIDEVEWTTQDDIVFSSTRSGNTNLWMVPATGGEPVQITKGSGPDIGIGISSDMKKLLYLQQLEVGNIWLTNRDGSSSRQITFEDQLLKDPSLSPDKKRIAYVLGDPDPTKRAVVGNVYVMDRDGQNRRQLTFESEAVRFPEWSPDGKWIAYQLGYVPSDSTRVYVIQSDARGRTSPKLITRGAFPTWLDMQTLWFVDWPRRTSFSISLQGGQSSLIYQDSTVAKPIGNGEYLIFRDHRKGRQGFYIIPVADVRAKRYDAAKKVGDLDVSEWALPPRGPIVLEYHQPGEIWKVSLPDLESERLGGAFTDPNIDFLSIRFSYDGKEAVYGTKSIRSKLVLIENFIK